MNKMVLVIEMMDRDYLPLITVEGKGEWRVEKKEEKKKKKKDGGEWWWGFAENVFQGNISVS